MSDAKLAIPMARNGARKIQKPLIDDEGEVLEWESESGGSGWFMREGKRERKGMVAGVSAERFPQQIVLHGKIENFGAICGAVNPPVALFGGSLNGKKLAKCEEGLLSLSTKAEGGGARKKVEQWGLGQPGQVESWYR
jgi:hypothetical protein